MIKKKYLNISEVSQMLQIEEHKIRYWDSKDPKTNKFIKVADFKDANITETWVSEMSCLVTSNHHIPIGEYTFYDWED